MVLTDAQWAVLAPLVEACRPHAKVPPSNLRRTVEAIVWRCRNGARWRSIPAELGPWWGEGLAGHRSVGFRPENGGVRGPCSVVTGRRRSGVAGGDGDRSGDDRRGAQTLCRAHPACRA